MVDVPALASAIQTAKQQNFSDAEITAHLATNADLAPKIAAARQAGLTDSDIVSHIAAQAPATAHPSENVFQKAARLTGEAYHSADRAYREDMQRTAQSHSLVDAGKTVLDAASAAFSPIKGVADATFGDKPVALPFGINSKGLTGGDIATFAIPAAGELAAGAKTAQFAKDAGIAAGTAEQTLVSSKAASAPPVSVARPNPTAATPANALATKADVAPAEQNALSVGMPKGTVPSVKNNPAATVENLQNAKKAAYDRVDEAGITVTPEGVSRLADETKAALEALSISPTRHPNAYSMLEDIQTLKGKPQTLTQLDQLRQVVRRDVINRRDDAEQTMGGAIIDSIDGFIQSLKDDEAAGAAPGSSAADMVTTARTANGQYKKAEAVSDALEAAQRQAAKSGSGANYENALRQQLDKVVSRTKNFTPDEKAAIDEIILGSKGQNTLRGLGKASPLNGGLHGAIGTLGAFTNPLTVIPATVTSAAKLTADARASKNVGALFDLIAAGGSKANVAEIQAWQKRLDQAQKVGPNAYSSAMGRLRVQMKANPALTPVYLSGSAALRAAQPMRAAAEPTNQAQ